MFLFSSEFKITNVFFLPNDKFEYFLLRLLKFSTNIINQALINYNRKYKTNLDLNSFALTISKYAGVKNKNGDLIADETIAEAIHDYYLHGNKCAKSSYEIVNIIKSRLQVKIWKLVITVKV